MDKATYEKPRRDLARGRQFLKSETPSSRPRIKAICFKRGTTLIELLAALTLSTVLVFAVVRLLDSVNRQRKAWPAVNSSHTWLAEQVRRDLVNAREMNSEPGELKLWGYCSRDFVSGRVTHRPAEISYQVWKDGSRSWLVRKEKHLDSRSNRNSRTELVGENIVDLRIEPLVADGSSESDQTGIPGQLRLTVYRANQDRPFLNRVLILE